MSLLARHQSMSAARREDTIDIPVLAANDLYERRRARDAARLKAYNKLLEQIYHRIRVVSKLPTHPTDLIYTIPPFILGIPRLDLEDCVVYLVYQLRNSGFEVRFTYPNMLFISWKHHEKEYVVNESPILQAMLATTPQPAPAVPAPPSTGRGGAPSRKKRGTGTQETSAETRAINAMMLPPNQQAQPLSAVDYNPPSGFIQAVERPAPAGRSNGDGSRGLFF